MCSPRQALLSCWLRWGPEARCAPSRDAELNRSWGRVAPCVLAPRPRTRLNPCQPGLGAAARPLPVHARGLYQPAILGSGQLTPGSQPISHGSHLPSCSWGLWTPKEFRILKGQTFT